MKQVFADTSYWIALLNPRDELQLRKPKYQQESSLRPDPPSRNRAQPRFRTAKSGQAPSGFPCNQSL
jgi:hypothetical protein